MSWGVQFLLCTRRTRILAHFRTCRPWHSKVDKFFVQIINYSDLDSSFDGGQSRSSAPVKIGQIWYGTLFLKHLLRMNRFLISLLHWTQLEPYFNLCKWRFVYFSRFWEIGLDTYGHFDNLVTGKFRSDVLFR